MKTELECEKLAREYLQTYSDQCRPGNRRDLLNVIAKMVAVAVRAYEIVETGKMEVTGPKLSSEQH